MYRVIDTICFRSSWTHHYPEFAERGEGLMAILDPDQISEPPEICGRAVRVRRPDGDTAELVATGSEVHHSVVGIFFKDVSSETLPPGSQFVW
jgi:hypothetical protein